MKNWPLHSFLRKGPDRFILKQVLFIKNTYYEAIFDLQPTKKTYDIGYSGYDTGNYVLLNIDLHNGYGMNWSFLQVLS